MKSFDGFGKIFKLIIANSSYFKFYFILTRLKLIMLKFIILSLLFILGFGGQSVPIPLHPDGLTLNANVNSFVLEAHYDLLCPDSRDSYFSLRNVLNATKDSVRFTIHFFPLPYHTYAHRAAIVAKVIATAYGDNTAWDFVNV